MSSSLLVRTVCVTAVLMVGSIPALSDVHPNRQRSGGSSFSVPTIDSVAPFNGNLSLAIPLGQSYGINDGLSYGLSLVYNSNLWVFSRYNGNSIEARLDPHSNAGVGWRLSLGKLLKPGVPGNSTDSWVYVDPRGGEHLFYPRLHPEDDFDSGIQYTRDGSYLRFREAATLNGNHLIEFPNGNIHTFSGANQGLLTRIEDRFGNALVVQLGTNKWTLSDGHRSHTINFAAGSNYGRVTSVVLAAFDGTPATYGFTYQSDQVIPRPCVGAGSGTSTGPSPTTTANFLTQVSLPDGSTYSMPTANYHLDTSQGCKLPGKIKAVDLPTLGRVEWTYQDYTYPETNDPWRTVTAGVQARTLKNAQGGTQGTWTYTPSLSANDKEFTNTATAPAPGGKVKHYFSVARTDGGGWSAAEYGLPITRNQTSPGPGFLSTEILTQGGTVLRKNYLSYAVDEDLEPGGNGPHPFLDSINVNRRVTYRRTLYSDDVNGHYADVTFSDWDGLGHHRTVTTGGDFPTGNTRVTTTRFNDDRNTYPSAGWDMIEPSEPWLLNLFDHRVVTEAGTSARMEYCFDASTGFLNSIRTLENASTRGSNDLMTTFSRSSGSSPVIDQRHYGGDTQSISTNSCVSNPAGSDQYRIKHTYQYGSLKKSQYFNAAGQPMGFLAVNQVINANTGLVSRSIDSSGFWVDFTYDDLGRMIWQKPQNDAWTKQVWGANRRSLSTFLYPNGQTSGTTLGQSEVSFGSLGRMFKEKRWMPVGSASRWHGYDGAGNRKYMTVWGAADSNGPRTEFQNHDVFGRPGKIRPADGSAHDVNLYYEGVRQVERIVKVHNGVSEVDSKTTETYDRQGRLYRVTEPSNSGANVTTNHTYDYAGRLINVNGNGQVRSFNYDRRGFLQFERHPEKGPSGSGYVVYCNYDALGNAGRTVDGASAINCSSQADTRDLQYTYLRDGLLEKVREDLGLGVFRDLKVFEYNPDRSLKKATRNNYVVTDEDINAAVVENYSYHSGQQGRLSSRSTSVSFNGVPSATFTQGWTYDNLGNVSATTYPECVSNGCAPDPRVVSQVYTKGWLTSLTEANHSIGITYHPSGMISQIQHPNSVTWNQGADPDGLGRPGSIYTTGVQANQNWNSGTYSYDGAGNIEAIGTSNFGYDKVSRLVSSTVYDGLTGNGAGHTQNFSFDKVGNMKTMGGVSIPVSSSTNRLTGAGVSYDAAGSQTEWNGRIYEHDPLGNLWHEMSGSGTGRKDWFYIYTADDERILEYFRTDLDLELLVPENYDLFWSLRDLDGKVLRRFNNHATERDYVYQNGQLLVSLFPDNSPSPHNALHFFSDHLGTPRLVTDQGGNKVSYHVYGPFGEELTPLDQDGERMKFTGHERDLGADLQSQGDDLDYMHARHYNMQLGRFLQVDPILGSSGVPQSWNRYAYAMGNPLKYTDPTGENIFSVFTAWGMIPQGLLDGFWAAPITVTAEGGGFSYFQYQVLFGRSGRVVQAAGRIGKVARAGGPWGLAVGAGIGLGWGINQIPGVSEALTHEGLTDWASDLMIAMGKRKGRVIPTDLIGKSADEIQRLLDAERALGRLGDKKRVRDLVRALKELGRRNKNKARGDRRAPKKPKKNG